MEQQLGHIKAEGQPLHYIKIGQGKKLLVAFHGYGNDATMFLPLAQKIGHEYTLLSFDLPHHGKSEWENGKLLTKVALASLAQQLCATFNVNKLSLAGYSLGGRLCLCLAEQMPNRIEQILLIASDGLVFNKFYHFVTKNYVGKRMFQRFTIEPQKYLRFTDWMNRRKLLNPSKYKFLNHYISNEDDRKFLLKVWTDLQQLVPDENTLQQAIKKHSIPLYIFMGKHDHVIPVKFAQTFIKRLPTAQLIITNKGHQIMDETTLPQMAQCLLHS